MTKLSENFKLSEFGGIQPHPALLSILQYLANRTKHFIIITNGPRSIQDHIKIYQDKFGDNWELKIPWKSRHLPKHGCPYLRAVDFKIVDKISKEAMQGDDIYNLIREACISKNYQGNKTGIGIASNWCHLDIDRDKHTMWRYG